MEAAQGSFIRFCPHCGSRQVTFTNNLKLQCNDCDFVLYHNVAAAVAVVFTFEDKLLFTVRNADPDKGKWDLPGGFIDPNENAAEASCREIKEELGLPIHPSDLSYITTAPNDYLYKNVPYRTLDIFFECHLKSDVVAIHAKDEIKELLWVKKADIAIDAIGFSSIRKVINEHFLI